jgi:hypothetical protein
MCGDLDEGDALETELVNRFRVHARALLAGRPGSGEPPDGPEPLHAYMDRLFAEALTRCVRDWDGTDEGERYAKLAAQPLVFARLAGFLAAHSSLREDPLRKVIEALMHGYAEAEAIEPDHRGHSHDHDHHHHGHDHHH